MVDLNELDLPALAGHLVSTGLVHRLCELARDEDVLTGHDVTSELCTPQAVACRADLRMREAGTVAGIAFIPVLLEVVAPGVCFEPHADDGEQVDPGTNLGVLSGPARSLLLVERPLLNLLGRLCGVATLTRRYVDAAGTRARIYDTRKTTPGLRVVEKYAVRCGGGSSHRLGLHDAVLIKDNHLAGVSLDELTTRLTSIAREVRPRRSRRELSFLEVEVDNLRQLERVLAVDAERIDVVLLDNFSLEALREAVAMRDQMAADVRLEASGGITFETVGAVCETGVDAISVGALTHGARSLDVGLDFANEPL